TVPRKDRFPGVHGTGCLKSCGRGGRKPLAPLWVTPWLATNQPPISPRMSHAMRHMQPLTRKLCLMHIVPEAGVAASGLPLPKRWASPAGERLAGAGRRSDPDRARCGRSHLLNVRGGFRLDALPPPKLDEVGRRAARLLAMCGDCGSG